MTQEHINMQGQSAQEQSQLQDVQEQLQLQEAQSREVAAGSADQQFEDAGLQSAVQAAFAQIEPSAEAEARMFANLLAYQQGTVVQEAAASEVAEEGEEAATSVEAAEDTTATFEAAQGKTSAAQVISAARSATPKPKRTIRAWQVLIPAAAVLVLVGVALLAIPQISPFGTTTQMASEAQVESAKLADEDAAVEEAVEEFWARDYPYVVLDNGTELVLDSPEEPTAVPASQVGALVADAIAHTSNGEASVACTVYRSTENESTYLVSYLGESIYFPAHEI